MVLSSNFNEINYLDIDIFEPKKVLKKNESFDKLTQSPNKLQYLKLLELSLQCFAFLITIKANKTNYKPKN